MTRVFDVIFAILALFLCSPLWTVVCVLLTINGEAILYRQRRIGKDGKEFFLYKFTTMKENSPNTLSGLITISDDPRVTSLGKILRKLKINECPQLINILRGELSFVGMRPLPILYFKKEYLEDYPHIFSRTPGLSSCATLIFHNEEEFFTLNNIDETYDQKVILPAKLSIDEEFFSDYSIKKYVLIAFHTFMVIFGQKTYRNYIFNLINFHAVHDEKLQNWIFNKNL